MSQTATEGKCVYMLRDGDEYSRSVSGPFLGDPGIDFVQLADTFRVERYAQAEAKGEDCCYASESDFYSWLVDKGFLTPLVTTDVEIELRHSGEKAYAPKHWPVCPECEGGRGEPHYGEVRRSLNRIKTFKRCTDCGHEWGYAEEANDTSRPMLEDDGRDTIGGCVPFAISKACGIEFATVLNVCARHGWSQEGMDQDKAIGAARELGYSLTWKAYAGVGSSAAPTLKRLLAGLPRGRNYVAGVRGHWLAIVDGQVVDNDTNGGHGRKVLELYEVGLMQAIAA